MFYMDRGAKVSTLATLSSLPLWGQRSKFETAPNDIDNKVNL